MDAHPARTDGTPAKCPRCGSDPDRPGATYCSKCGARFDAVPVGSHGFGVAFVFLLITVGVFSALWFVITFVLK
jgi:hypothetical protein